MAQGHISLSTTSRVLFAKGPPLTAHRIYCTALLPSHERRVFKGPFGKAPAPASLALDLDPREELILLILLENQNHF
jgi:hypothetical protein